MSAGWEYANVGFCMVDRPRWFARVFLAVGLIGDGLMGVRGSMGDLRESDDRWAGWTEAAMLRESFGLAAREASISAYSESIE